MPKTKDEIIAELCELNDQYELAESVLCNASRLMDRLSALIQPLEDALTRMEEEELMRLEEAAIAYTEQNNGKLSEARTVPQLRFAG